MAQQIQDIMTKQVHKVSDTATLLDVARLMRDQKIGDVLVTDQGGSLCGIVTDRDIVVRADADGKALDKTKVGEICSGELVKLSPTDSVEDAVKLMRDRAIRRVPVVKDGQAIGIVSIGDLARHRDPRSALADISKAGANN
ncbi:MAG: CBS domain-containing protein [Kofleriaceae bacterium]|nr:CBS domain-containing protein [Kofleriaceae bacterium]